MDDFGCSNQIVRLRDSRELGFTDHRPQSGTPALLFYTHFGQILQQVVAHGQEL